MPLRINCGLAKKIHGRMRFKNIRLLVHNMDWDRRDDHDKLRVEATAIGGRGWFLTGYAHQEKEDASEANAREEVHLR